MVGEHLSAGVGAEQLLFPGSHRKSEGQNQEWSSPVSISQAPPLQPSKHTTAGTKSYKHEHVGNIPGSTVAQTLLYFQKHLPYYFIDTVSFLREMIHVHIYL